MIELLSERFSLIEEYDDGAIGLPLEIADRPITITIRHAAQILRFACQLEPLAAMSDARLRTALEQNRLLRRARFGADDTHLIVRADLPDRAATEPAFRDVTGHVMRTVALWWSGASS